MKVECKDGYPRSSGPVHNAFGLTYSAYYTVPRLALQGMPLWWQKIFVWLVEMLPDTPEYVCQRRDTKGKFIKDPWANYRRGSVEKLIEETKAEEKQQGWKILNVEDNNH